MATDWFSLAVTPTSDGRVDWFSLAGDSPEDDGPSWGDYGRSVMAGGASLAGGAGWALERLGADTVGGWLRDKSKNAVEYWNNGMSDAAKQELQKEFVTQDDEGNYHIGDAGLSTVGLMAAQSVLGTMAGMGAGGAIAKGLNLIPKLGPTISGALGYGLGESLVSAPSNAEQAGQRVAQMTDEQLAEHPEYAATLEGVGGDKKKARELIQRAAEDDAGALSAITTFILSAPAGAVFGKALSGIPLSTTRPRAIATGALGEAAQEFGQSGAEQYTQNLAIQRHADAGQSLSEGVLNQAIGGAAAGGPMGGAFGTVAPLDVPKSDRIPPDRFARPEDTDQARTIETVMSTGSVDDAINTALNLSDETREQVTGILAQRIPGARVGIDQHAREVEDADTAARLSSLGPDLSRRPDFSNIVQPLPDMREATASVLSRQEGQGIEVPTTYAQGREAFRGRVQEAISQRPAGPAWEIGSGVPYERVQPRQESSLALAGQEQEGIPYEPPSRVDRLSERLESVESAAGGRLSIGSIASRVLDALNKLNPQLGGRLRAEVLSEKEMRARPVNEEKGLEGLGTVQGGHNGAVINLTEQSDVHALLEEARHMIDMLLGGWQVSKYIDEDSAVKEKVIGLLKEKRKQGDLAKGARFTDGKEIAQALLDQYFRHPEDVRAAVPEMADFLDSMNAGKYREALQEAYDQAWGSLEPQAEQKGIPYEAPERAELRKKDGSAFGSEKALKASATWKALTDEQRARYEPVKVEGGVVARLRPESAPAISPVQESVLEAPAQATEGVADVEPVRTTSTQEQATAKESLQVGQDVSQPDILRQETVAASAPPAESDQPLFSRSQREVTETPEFKAWFGEEGDEWRQSTASSADINSSLDSGDTGAQTAAGRGRASVLPGRSKVVDKDGQPLVVYSGTFGKDFDAFRMPSYFSESAIEASAYSFAFPKAKRDAALAKPKYKTSTETEGLVGAEVPHVGIIGDIPYGDTRVWATDQGVVQKLEDGTVIVFTGVVVDKDKGAYNPVDDTFRLVKGDNTRKARKLLTEYREAVDRAYPPGEGEGGRVIPVYLSIKNPKEMAPLEANKFGKRLGGTRAQWNAAVQELEAEGYDGIVTYSDEATVFPQVRESMGGIPKQWIPLRPEQIKSQFNRGTFDRDNPDIRFSRADESAQPFSIKRNKDGSVVVSGDVEAIRAAIPDDVRGRATEGGLAFTPSAAPRVIAAIEGRKIAYSRAGRVLDKKPMKDGKYIGAPARYNTPAKIPHLRKWLNRLTDEGAPGRYWYENSSAEILRMTQGDEQEARRFVALLAIYSSQAKVDANATFALRAWAQYKAGQPINVKTGSQDEKARAALSDVDAFWRGEKTGNFVTNLLRMIDSSVADKQGATVDMWMMRAGHYGHDAPKPTEYAFMEDEINRIAQDRGWEPQQVQAAIWVAMKARMENKGVKQATEQRSESAGWIRFDQEVDQETGKKKKTRVILNPAAHRNNWLKRAFEHDPTADDTAQAKFDFGDAMLRHIGQISFEARPGRSTGVLPGIHSAPYEQQLEFQQAVQAAFLDEDGTDTLAQMLGLMADSRSDVLPGVWQGEVSPSQQQRVAMAPAKGEAGKKNVDPAQAEALNIYAAMSGLVARQEGVGWHRPFYSATKRDSNGLDIRLGRPITPGEAASLERGIDAWMRENGREQWQDQFAIISSASGVRLVTFGAVDNKTLQSDIVRVAEGVLPDAVADWFASSSDMPTNDWKENPNGQDYIARASAAGRSDVLIWTRDVLAPRVQSVFEEFSERYGWGNPGRLEISVPGETGTGQEVSFSRAEGRDTEQFPRAPNQLGARILNVALVKYGLGADWINAYETVTVPDALSTFGQEVQTAFGRNVRFVAPTAEKFNIFNGVQLPSSPGSVYVNVNAKPNIVGIAGHEIWHTLERERPDLHKWFVEQLGQHLQNLDQYQAKLNKLLQPGESAYTAEAALNELAADFTGDAMSDPAFLQKLADNNPSRFKALLNAVLDYLKSAIAKLKGLDSSRYVSDVEALRDRLASALNAFAEGGSISEAAGGASFSRGQSAPLWVSTLTQRMREQGDRTRTGSEWSQWLPANAAKFGIKKDEIEWSGVTDYLKLRGKEKVSGDEIAEWLDGNGVQVEEVTLGAESGQRQMRIDQLRAMSDEELQDEADSFDVEFDADDREGTIRLIIAEQEDDMQFSSEAEEAGEPKFAQYQLPGGENYKELLLTLPRRESPVVTWSGPTSVERFDQGNKYHAEQWTASDGARITSHPYRGFVINSELVQNAAQPSLQEAKAFYAASKRDAEATYRSKSEQLGNFHSSHFSQPNILAHVRFNERTDAEGRRVLFLEELQSDWGASNRQAFQAITKPDSVRELAQNVLGAQMASMMPFNEMDGGMLAALKNEQIIEAVVANLPVDVMNYLGGSEGSAKRALRNPDVLISRLPLDHARKVADALLSAMRGVGTSLRAKLLELRNARRDGNLLPTLKASDLDTRVVVGLLAPERLYHVGLLGRTASSDVAGARTEMAGRSSNARGAGAELDTAMRADLGRHGGGAFGGAKASSSPARSEAEMSSTSLANLVDWHTGIIYSTGAPQQGRYIPGPFVSETKNYTALALKRIIRYAVDNGFDAISWTTGEQQAERYDLSKQLDSVSWALYHSKQVDVFGVRKDTGDTIKLGRHDAGQLSDVVGKELADKINTALDRGEKNGEFLDTDLKIGGEGMRGYYDGIVPQVAKDVLKKLGGGQIASIDMGTGRIGPYVVQRGDNYNRVADFDTEAEAGEYIRDHYFDFPDGLLLVSNASEAHRVAETVALQAQPGFLLTDQMREKASQGMPLFSKKKTPAPEVKADPYADLEGIEITETVKLEDTGEEYEVTRNAAAAARQLDKKIDSAYRLLECLR